MNAVDQARRHIPGLPWQPKPSPPLVMPAVDESKAQAHLSGVLFAELHAERPYAWMDKTFTLDIIRCDPAPVLVCRVGERESVADVVWDLRHACDHARTILHTIIVAARPPDPFPPGVEGLLKWFPLTFDTLSSEPPSNYRTPPTDRFLWQMKPVDEYALCFEIGADLAWMALALYRVHHETPDIWTHYGTPLIRTLVDQKTSMGDMLSRFQKDAEDTHAVLNAFAYYFDPRKGKAWHPQPNNQPLNESPPR